MARRSSITTAHIRKLSFDLKSLAHVNETGLRLKSGKPTMDIQIDQHYSAKTYASGSKISGHVVINSPRDIPFDEFEILFTGHAATRVDFINHAATHATRMFMKLRMPLRASDFPNPRVFQAGHTYTIPFNFVVPHQLTLDACTHHCTNPNVRDHHLRLPPSMGYWESDDQAPEMARIEYAIRASAFRSSEEEGKTMPLEASHLIKVLPALPEDAPLDITAKDERYHLSKSKTIRKNIFSAKSGKITATASQPGAIMLSADGARMSESSMRINLKFDCASADSTPPKINSVTAKLQATTYFSNASMDVLPNLGSRVSYRTNPSLTYSTSNPLITNPIDAISWSQQTSRRDSGYSSWSAEDGSESDGTQDRHHRTKKSNKAPVQHVATLDIPFALAASSNKLYLPSFHNCLISRAYSIHLNISVGPMNANIPLTIPLQVAMDTVQGDESDNDLPSFESAMAQSEETEADMHLLPRLIQVPSARYQGNSILPGYNDLNGRSIAAC